MATETNQQHVAGAERPVAVWDLPVRFFHWALVLLIIFQYVSYKMGGNWMTYHMWGGYSILGLVVFRVLWGFFGSTHARFGDFIYGPRAIFAYIKTLPSRKAAKFAGHNPLGGWSVLLMLLALLVQAVTGLFGNDDIMIEGPLYNYISKSTSDFLTTIHRYNFYVLLTLVGIHIAAVLYYLAYKSENLIKAMFSGKKMLPEGVSPPGAQIKSSLQGIVILAIAVAAVYLLIRKW